MNYKEDFVVECSLIEHSSFNWIKNQFSKAWAASFLSFLHIFFFFFACICVSGDVRDEAWTPPPPLQSPVVSGLKLLNQKCDIFVALKIGVGSCCFMGNGEFISKSVTAFTFWTEWCFDVFHSRIAVLSVRAKEMDRWTSWTESLLEQFPRAVLIRKG